MKLETSVPLRKDGTVIVRGLDGERYDFIPEPDTGLVACSISHEPTLAHLLRLGTFFPADEADHAHASALVDTPKPKPQDPEAEPELDSELDDDPVDPNALPIEGGTPPAPRRGKAKAAQ